MNEEDLPYSNEQDVHDEAVQLSPEETVNLARKLLAARAKPGYVSGAGLDVPIRPFTKN